MYDILVTWLGFPDNVPLYVQTLSVLVVSSIFFIFVLDILKILLYSILRR